MSVQELKHWAFKCDGCGFRFVMATATKPAKPDDGWEAVTHQIEITFMARPSSNYTEFKNFHFCQSCIYNDGLDALKNKLPKSENY